MIRARIAGKRFGGAEVLGKIALDVAAGETVAITGPSGVGKTTLLRLLAGLDTVFEGEIEVPQARAMVFQEPTLLPWRSALDNIRITTGVAGDRAEGALREVGLAGKSAHFPGQLSLGQQRRLGLARAFAAEPEVLLMDEPFVSLDPALTEEMLGLTETLLARRKIATVLVTHAQIEAERLATRILRLEGQPAQIIEG